MERNQEELTGQKSRMVSWAIKKLIPILKIAAPMAFKGLYGKLFPKKAREKALREWDDWPRRIENLREKASTLEEKLEIIDIGRYTLAGFGTLSYIAPVMNNVEKARKIASPHFEDTSEFSLVEKSVPHNITTEMGLELMQIAEKYDKEGKKPHPGEKEIQDFLDRFGTRSNQEIDLGVPQWKEEPGYVIDLIQSYIDNGSYKNGIENFEKGKQEAEKAIASIKRRLIEAGEKGKAKKVESLLKSYRHTFGLREHSKYALTQMFSIYREILLDIGKQFVLEGKIDDKNDIFFLRFEEIKKGENLQELVKANREEYEKNLLIKAPRIITSTGESIYYPVEEGDEILTGIPVSAGVCSGRVRVLSSPEQGPKLEKGDVLVTRGTNPAWTPLFINAGALIMETGGPISHGSVVAREYGVPAVVGIKEATKRFKDGQMVKVNGETGTVEII